MQIKGNFICKELVVNSREDFMQNQRVILPIEKIEQLWPQELKNARIGALLHPASILPNYQHTLDVLNEQNGKIFQLKALFGPQHGILGHTQDNMIEWEGYLDPELGIPVYSLYGEHRQPTKAMYEGLDAILVDLQDVGARYYTFIWSLYLCMKTAEETGIHIVVCDRPNPINSKDKEGPILDLEYSSFVGLHSIPVRHGKNIGELAEQFKKECFPSVKLTVLEMENYDKSMWFDQTGLPWVLPSPNMPTLDTATVYPGMCLLEATNVSEGRGTTKPFELFGAPFIDANKFASYMNSQNFPGVIFREAYFQPTFHKGAGKICAGLQYHVLDRDIFRSFEVTISILRYLFHTYPEDFKWRTEAYEYEYDKLAIDILLGSKDYRLTEIEGKLP